MLVLLALDRLGYYAGTQAAGANAHLAHCAIGSLVANALQIGFKSAFGFDVGMADQIADLGLFAAEFTFLAHIFDLAGWFVIWSLFI